MRWGMLLVIFAGCDNAVAPAALPDLAQAPTADLLTPDPSLAPIPAAPCPDDMVAIDDFCMDRYEAPNVAGEKPLAMQTAPDGESWCNAHGKRLCTEAEWVRACQGPNLLPYPYGTTYRKGTCDDDKLWIAPDWTTLGTWPSAAAMAEAERLYQADPSGARTGCVSAEGVYDLTGNVAEWVVRSFDHANNYSHVMKGCYWSGCYGGSPPSCGFTNPAHPGTFRSYEAGFRCCR
jgi:formylglycine-generating enzyme required for sulfatase activity